MRTKLLQGDEHTGAADLLDLLFGGVREVLGLEDDGLLGRSLPSTLW